MKSNSLTKHTAPLSRQVRKISSLLMGALIVILAAHCSTLSAQESNQTPTALPPQSNASTTPPDSRTAPSDGSPGGPVLSPSDGASGRSVTILENTLIRVVTDQPLSTDHSKVGTAVLFTVNEDVVVNRVLLIPRGAKIHGEVMQARKAGVANGASELKLELTSLELGGESYPLYTYQLSVHGASKEKPPAEVVAGGAMMGAFAGAVIASSAKGGTTRANTAVDIAGGAAAGAGVVEAASLLSPRPVLNLPAESQMDFYLASPISVRPVSAKEVEKLAQRIRPGGPVLYIRGETP